MSNERDKHIKSTIWVVYHKKEKKAEKEEERDATAKTVTGKGTNFHLVKEERE